jgi:hypothetical protein
MHGRSAFRDLVAPGTGQRTLLSNNASAHKQSIAIRNVFHQFGVSYVQPRSRSKAGIQHQGVDIALSERTGRKLRKGSQLTP